MMIQQQLVYKTLHQNKHLILRKSLISQEEIAGSRNQVVGVY